MKRVFSYLLVMLMLGFSVVSCNDDDNGPKGEFSSGVLVVNEGAFGKSDGSISFYDPSSGEVKLDIFGLRNEGKATGDVVQSVTVDGDLAYVVINNDDQMKVVNSNSFVSEYTLEGVTLPRYFTTYGGKGYLTEWVSFTDKGAVAVVNLQSHKIETTITTDFGAENIIAANEKLFISNNFTNTISVLNPATNTVTTTLEVAGSPGEFVIDSDNKLWVICGGDYGLDNGALYKINPSTNAIEKTIELGVSTSSHLVINKDKNQLYYISGKQIFKVSTTNPAKPANAFISNASIVSAYGIGVDPKTDIIYVGDSKGFQVNGVVYRYKNDGTLIDSFTVGKGPNGFVFR
ncbi:MAG TPA: DUF5074 domain-containing protein [Cyclobacteriaceae bacterium]